MYEADPWAINARALARWSNLLGQAFYDLGFAASPTFACTGSTNSGPDAIACLAGLGYRRNSGQQDPGFGGIRRSLERKYEAAPRGKWRNRSKQTTACGRYVQGKLPEKPEAQNAEWYKLYKSVWNDVVMSQVHRSFLFLRDFAALSAMFIAIYGLTGLYFITTKTVALGYLGILLAQYLIVRQAAHNASVVMVTNVLALKTSGR